MNPMNQQIDPYQTGITLAQADPAALDSMGGAFPAGVYPLALVKHEQASSTERSKDSWVGISCEFAVTGHELDGRRLWELFILAHPKQQTVAIAVAQIQAWALAVGLSGQETINKNLLDELIARPFLAKVRIEKGKQKPVLGPGSTVEYYPDKNRIERFMPPEQQAQIFNAHAGAAATGAATAGGTAPVPGTAPQPQMQTTNPAQAATYQPVAGTAQKMPGTA